MFQRRKYHCRWLALQQYFLSPFAFQYCRITKLASNKGLDMMVDSLVYEEPVKTRQLIWPSTEPPQQPVFEQCLVLRIIKEVCWS